MLNRYNSPQLIIALAALAAWIMHETLRVCIIRTALGSPSDIKAVQISDIHSQTLFINGRLSVIVNKVSPDVVFITGDLANGHVDLEKVLREIKDIKCPHILFVPGNYEREDANLGGKVFLDPQEYRRIINLIGKNITVLENESVSLYIKGRSIWVYGFDNSLYRQERPLSGKIPDADRIILLAHSPNIISLIQRMGLKFDALLVGHTHGGQIRLMGRTFGAYRKYAAGKNDSPDGLFYVNRGLGTTRLPIRIGSPPEILVLNL